MAWDLGDYKEVSERLDDLFAKHPEASMRGTYEFVTIGDQAGVAYRAECFRFPDDPAPGVGSAWEDVPGKSSYTKGSELQNAETSAWGRAIVAAGASTSKKVASANEVRSAQARQKSHEGSATAGARESLPAPTPAAPAELPTSKLRRENLKARCVALGPAGVSIHDERQQLGLPLVDRCTEAQLVRFENMVDDLERTLEAPFEKADA